MESLSGDCVKAVSLIRPLILMEHRDTETRRLGGLEMAFDFDWHSHFDFHF